MLISEIVAMTVVPILISLTWRSWLRNERMPSARRGLGLASLVLLTCAWLGAASWNLSDYVPLWDNRDWIELTFLVRLLQFSTLLLALAALRKTTLWYSIIAIVVFAVTWPLGYT